MQHAEHMLLSLCADAKFFSVRCALRLCSIAKGVFRIEEQSVTFKTVWSEQNPCTDKGHVLQTAPQNLGFRRVFGFMMLIICASAASLLLALRISESGSLVNGDTVDSAAVFSPLRFASNNSPDDAAKAMTRVRQVGFSLFSCLQF